MICVKNCCVKRFVSIGIEFPPGRSDWLSSQQMNIEGRCRIGLPPPPQRRNFALLRTYFIPLSELAAVVI